MWSAECRKRKVRKMKSVEKQSTVDPVYNGYPRNFRNWPLNTSGRLIQDH